MINKNIDYKAVAKMSDEKQFYISLKKKGQKSKFWRRKIRDREEYLIIMQHALTVQHENRHYWNIKNYTFGIKEYETKHAVSVQSEDLSLFEILDVYGEQKQQ